MGSTPKVKVLSISAFTLILLVSGCKNPCVDMCQQIDAWLDECGTTWEAEYENEGWKSVDDCYDDHWEAKKSKRQTCANRANKFEKKDCY